MFSQIHFQSLPVLDLGRALAFYRDVMGFSVERDDPYGDSRWIFMALPEGQTRLHFEVYEALPEATTPRLVLLSDNVDAACETLRARGVPLRSGPEDAPWAPGTRFALFDDSEGNLVLIQTIS